MKTKYRIRKSAFALCELLTVIALIAMLAALLLSPPAAKAQVLPATPTALTNLPAYVVGGAQSNITSHIFSFRQGKGFAVFADSWGTNAATTAATTFRFAPGYKIGTNYYWATTNLAEFVLTANGTSTNRGYQNFAPPSWDNFSHFKLLNITNANASTNKTYLTNVVIVVGN